MERETGIEPVTSSLGSWRSTAELLPLARTDPSLRLDFVSGLPASLTLRLTPANRLKIRQQVQNITPASEQHNPLEFRQHFGKQGDC